LYDSTLRIIDQLIERGKVAFEHEVIPGITAVQALAAGHKIALNRIGKSVHITTGRKLAQGLPDGIDDVIVMLDGDCSFKAIEAAGIDIYWGAYVGTPDEILIAGDLREVADRIEQVRAAAKARKGWVMDTYLLRKRDP
jgi:precorrin-6A synthase